MFTRREAGIRTVRIGGSAVIQSVAFLWQAIVWRPKHVEIYFHSGSWRAIRWQAALCQLLGLPIVCICTGGELQHFDSHTPQKERCIRSVFSNATAVILKELYMRDVIIRHGLIDLGKTHLISNRVHVGDKPEIGRRAPVVLFLNLYKRWRRVELVVAAAALVRAAIPGIRFRLVGAGRYPEYEAELIEQAKALDVEDIVEFLPFTQDPAPYYAEAAVFVLPADIVFCNNALLEAMERGIPPVVADVDGAERIVEHGRSGLMAAQTADAIANAVIQLLADESARQAMGSAARQIIEDRFDECQRTGELLSLYRREVWSICRG